MVFRNSLATEMSKISVKTNKPVYLGLSILEISKTLMYEFWYDYIKIVLYGYRYLYNTYSN